MFLNNKSTFFLFLCLFFFSLHCEASPPSIRIYSAGSWIEGGDLNRNIQGWTGYFADRNLGPYEAAFSLKELHRQKSFGAEILYPLTSGLSVGLGVEFLTGATEGEAYSRLSQEQDYFNSAEDFGTIFIDEQSTQDPRYKLQSMPLNLTFYYSFPFGSRFVFFLGCGGSYYFGRLTYTEDYEYSFNYKDEKNLSGTPVEFVDRYSSTGIYSEDTTCNALGLHALSGLEVRIGRRLHLVVEAFGRKVGFSGWKGTKNDRYTWNHTYGYWGEFSDQGSSEESERGTLWMVDLRNDETGNSYPRFIFSEERPASPSYTDVRPARISLSGFSFRVGIKISL